MVVWVKVSDDGTATVTHGPQAFVSGTAAPEPLKIIGEWMAVSDDPPCDHKRFSKKDDRGYYCDDCGKKMPVTEPIRNAVPRVGRNEPCPCGSGKKYKRCCMDTNRAIGPE